MSQKKDAQDLKIGLLTNMQSSKQKLETLKNFAYVLGGAGAGIAAFGYMPSLPFLNDDVIPIPDEPQVATSVNDDMTYQEAFDTARTELGAGHLFNWHGNTFTTYTQEEWGQLDEDYQSTYQNHMNEVNDSIGLANQEEHIPFIVHDVAPVATEISDDMSFNDAFATARHEVGPGGVFTWHGKLYNTYYENEWNSMDDGDRVQFSQSINHSGLDHNNIHPSRVDYSEHFGDIGSASEEFFLRDEVVELENGQTVHVGYFQSGNEIIVKLDVDNDGTYDFIADQDSGQLIGLNGNADVDLSQYMADAQMEVTPVTSEYIDIEGHNALVTTMSDGSQQALVDIDGDGTFDINMTIDTNGNMTVQDMEGNLISQESINLDDALFGGEDLAAFELMPDDMSYASNDLADAGNDDFGADFDNRMDVSDWV